MIRKMSYVLALVSMSVLSVSMATDQKTTPERIPPETPREAKAVGTLFLGIKAGVISEGDNFDIELSLRNDSDQDIVSVGSPQPGVNVAYLLQKRQDGKKNSDETPMGIIGEPGLGDVIQLKKKEKYTLSYVFFRGDGSGLCDWLEPGTYLLQLVYYPQCDKNVSWKGQNDIAWGKPIYSGGVQLTVEPAATELKMHVANAKSFLAKDTPDFKDCRSIRDACHEAISPKLSASLQRRVCWHGVQLMDRKARNAEERELVVAELESLIKGDLSAGEAEFYKMALVNQYIELKRENRAFSLLDGLTSARAEFLRESLRSELGNIPDSRASSQPRPTSQAGNRPD